MIMYCEKNKGEPEGRENERKKENNRMRRDDYNPASHMPYPKTENTMILKNQNLQIPKKKKPETLTLKISNNQNIE
jgi:hypothetical protein